MIRLPGGVYFLFPVASALILEIPFFFLRNEMLLLVTAFFFFFWNLEPYYINKYYTTFASFPSPCGTSAE